MPTNTDTDSDDRSSYTRTDSAATTAGAGPARVVRVPEGSRAPDSLLTLLDRFKAARRRRDASPYGSPAWTSANREIETLQRQIFDLSLDEPADRAVGPVSPPEGSSLN